MGPSQVVLPFWLRVNLGEIATKKYSTFPRSLKLEPFLQMPFNVIRRTPLFVWGGIITLNVYVSPLDRVNFSSVQLFRLFHTKTLSFSIFSSNMFPNIKKIFAYSQFLEKLYIFRNFQHFFHIPLKPLKMQNYKLFINHLDKGFFSDYLLLK